MTSTQKAKGDAFELSITRYLVTRGLDAVRTRAGYERDYGDVHIRRAATSVWPSVALQLKNHARLDLSGWLRGLPAQVAEARALTGALVVKRRGYGDPAKQYVVMELDAYLELLDHAGLTEQAPPLEGHLAKEAQAANETGMHWPTERAPDLLGALQESIERHKN